MAVCEFDYPYMSFLAERMNTELLDGNEKIHDGDTVLGIARAIAICKNVNAITPEAAGLLALAIYDLFPEYRERIVSQLEAEHLKL